MSFVVTLSAIGEYNTAAGKRHDHCLRKSAGDEA